MTRYIAMAVPASWDADDYCDVGQTSIDVHPLGNQP
jgi:hypothetical protein